MTEALPLYERLNLVADVSNLLLNGSIKVYHRPETRIIVTTPVVHDYRIAA